MDEIQKAVAAIRAQGGDEAAVQRYLASLGAKEVSPADSAITDLNAASERSARASAREAQSAEEKKLTGPQRIGAAAQNALGMASWGVSNLAGDAIDAMFSDRTFAANRQARRMTNEATPTPERVAAMVGGALLNPAGALVKAPATAGFLARTGAVAADAALQGGGTAAVEAFDEASPAGLLRAGRAGLAGATNAVAGTAGFRTGMLAARNINTMRRAATATPIDKVAFEMRDAMKAADDALYGAVRQEAGAAGTTPAIRDVLESQTVAPFAQMIRRSETYKGADDATVLTEAYKLMSEVQRRAAKSAEGTPEFLAGVDLKRRDIGLAKGRMMDAAEEPGLLVVPGRARTVAPPTTAQSPAPTVREAIEAHRTRLGQTVTRREGTSMQQTAREALERHDTENIVSPSLTGAPSPLRAVTRESETIELPGALPTFRRAVETHRIAAGENEAFLKTSDAVRRILEGNSVRGKKLTIESPEALRRAIDQMTPAQASRALQATLGRGREVARLTANPVGKFGIVSSVARSLHAPFQINEFVLALQKKAGIKPSPFDNPVVTERGAGMLARTAGGMTGLLAPR